MDELRYYRSMFFLPAPGPDGAQSKAGAEQIEQTSLLRHYEESGDPVEDANKPEKTDY